MASETVSVVIPAFNAEQFIEQTINSVLAQTTPAQEILVVDDGSTDKTAEVVSKFGRPVELIQIPNSGVSHARNLGFERATSEWVAFLDADDTWVPEKLATLLKYGVVDPQATLVFSDYQTFGLEVQPVDLSETFRNWRREQELLSPIVCVLPSAAMVRRGVSARFPEWAGNDNEDTIYFNDLADEGSVIHVPERLVNYRKHPTSAQKKTGVGDRAEENMLRRYMTNPRDRARFANTLLALMRQRRMSRKWHDFDTYFRILQANWPGEYRLLFSAHAMYMSKYVYKLKDRLDRCQAG